MMNERIQELLLKAGWDRYEALDERNQKFAELIVQECCAIADESERADLPVVASKLIKAHFGG